MSPPGEGTGTDLARIRSRRRFLTSAVGASMVAVIGTAGGESRADRNPVSRQSGATAQNSFTQTARLTISELSTNSPVPPGEELEVSYTITNEGDVGEIQTVTVSVQDVGSQTKRHTLYEGQTTSVTVVFDTPADPVGETTVTVETEDDTATTSVFLGNNPPTDSEDGGDVGSIPMTLIAAIGGGGGLLALLGGYALLRRRGEDAESGASYESQGDVGDGESERPELQETTGGPPESAHSPSRSEPVTQGTGDQSPSPPTESQASPPDSASDTSPTTASAGAGVARDDTEVDVDAQLEDIESRLAEARQHLDENEYDQALDVTEQAIEDAESLREVAETAASDRVSDIDSVLADAREFEEGIETEREDYHTARERYQDLSNTYEELALQADPADPFENLRDLGGLTTRLDTLEELIEKREFEALARRIDTLRK